MKTIRDTQVERLSTAIEGQVTHNAEGIRLGTAALYLAFLTEAKIDGLLIGAEAEDATRTRIQQLTY